MPKSEGRDDRCANCRYFACFKFDRTNGVCVRTGPSYLSVVHEAEDLCTYHHATPKDE